MILAKQHVKAVFKWQTITSHESARTKHMSSEQHVLKMRAKN